MSTANPLSCEEIVSGASETNSDLMGMILGFGPSWAAAVAYVGSWRLQESERILWLEDYSPLSQGSNR